MDFELNPDELAYATEKGKAQTKTKETQMEINLNPAKFENSDEEGLMGGLNVTHIKRAISATTKLETTLVPKGQLPILANAGLESEPCIKPESLLANRIPGISRMTSVPWTLRHYLEKIPFMDPKAPYQRAEVWPEKMKKRYVENVMAGILPQPTTLVQKSLRQSHYYWVLDGKQRYCALRDFWNNKFKITLIGTNDKEYSLYWREIQTNHPDLAAKFENATIRVDMYEPMPMSAQKLLFGELNQSTPMRYDEVLYGTNYMFRQFLEYEFETSFWALKRYAKPQISQNQHNFGTRTIHNVFILSFGEKFDDVFATRGYLCAQRRKSAEAMEKYLTQVCKLRDDNHPEWDTDLLTYTNLYNQHVLFTMACIWLREILASANGLVKDKKLDTNFFVDLLSFLIKWLQLKVLNTTYVRANLKKFNQMIVTWMEHKINDKLLTERTQDAASTDRRYTSLYHCALEAGIDLTPKGKPATTSEKTMASLKAGERCPVDPDVALTDDNVQYDHTLPKSMGGANRKIVAVSQPANKAKGDNTPESLQRVTDYVNKEKEER